MAKTHYSEIADRYRQQIINGELAVGDQMPTQREIAGDWSASQSTVSRAIATLIAEGILESRGTAGIFVAADQPGGDTAWRLTGRYARARAAQSLIFSSDIEGEITKATVGKEWTTAPKKVADLLGVDSTTEVFRRTSRTYHDGVPVEETAMHFPAAIVTDAPELETADNIQVVGMIEATGRIIGATENLLRARHATQAERDLLRLDDRAVIFEHTHGTFTDDGEPVEAVVNIKPADGVVLTFETYEGPLGHEES